MFSLSLSVLMASPKVMIKHPVRGQLHLAGGATDITQDSIYGN